MLVMCAGVQLDLYGNQSESATPRLPRQCTDRWFCATRLAPLAADAETAYGATKNGNSAVDEGVKGGGGGGELVPKIERLQTRLLPRTHVGRFVGGMRWPGFR
jgi:hypothetical protein